LLTFEPRPGVGIRVKGASAHGASVEFIL
jgi:hypothetical protein